MPAVDGPAADDVNEFVWRVGYAPDPWAWPGWEWATDGRFGGRWDDAEGNFRTIYAGATLLACLLEVLACFRPDQIMADELAELEEDPEDVAAFPSAPAGLVPTTWLESRRAVSATLNGSFARVTSAEWVSFLRPRFVARAIALGRSDFDASALKDSDLRSLTQAIATYLHDAMSLTGLSFPSRLGDDLALYAVFEFAGDPPISPRLGNLASVQMKPDDPDIVEAFRLLGLSWREDRAGGTECPDAGEALSAASSIEGLDGELIDRLIALVDQAPPEDPDWWRNNGFLAAYWIGGGAAFDHVDRAPAMAGLKERLAYLVQEQKISEELLVRGVIEALDKHNDQRADTGRHDAMAAGWREHLLEVLDDPLKLAEWARLDPQFSEDEVIARIHELLEQPLARTSSADDAAASWTRLDRWRSARDELLSETVLTHWAAEHLARGIRELP